MARPACGFVIYLIVVSLVWGFSFSLFKKNLAGLDPNLTASLRMVLALPLFLPMLRTRGLRGRQIGALLLVGAVQYGVMYATLNASYRYLEGWQVALMTIFTPIYVSLLDGAFWRRRLDTVELGLAGVAVVGAAAIYWREGGFSAGVTGFLLVQAANLCFAFGQLFYRELRKGIRGVPDARLYALPYLGAFGVTAVAALGDGGWRQLPSISLQQWGVLLYLGAIASGLCFFLWNLGATKVNTGTLAVMNNLKIPLAMVVGLLVFHESADVTRLIIGGGVMALAVVATERHGRRSRSQAG